MSEWDLGDTVPLTLVVPTGDVTTGATIEWTAPDLSIGTVTPAPATDVDEPGVTWTANHVVNQAGTWVFTWTITGMGAGVESMTVYVTDKLPLPWIPTLRDVADYVATRTVPVTGTSSTPLMTFTTATQPTGEQVYRQIRSAVRWVTNATGTIKEPLYAAARDVASLRAAGMVEMSWPERDANLNTARDLLAQADAALKQLIEANQGATDEEPGDPDPQLSPIFYMPDATTTEDIPQTRTSDWGGAKQPHPFWPY